LKNVYELINPSDKITFKTGDDKIAFFCSLYLGSGKTGAKRFDENGDEVDIPSLMLFDTEPLKTAAEYLGKPFDEYLKDNEQEISECFLSFSYGGFEERRTFDDALEAITDPEKKKEFKAKHEDRNRSSMSQWVAHAWNVGEALIKNKQGTD